MKPFSNRLNKLQEYFFEKANKKIKLYEERSGQKAINLGIGSPDLPPSEEIIKTAIDGILKSENHKYPSYTGLPELKQAITEYYGQRFNVELNPENEVLPLLGSKEGIANLHLALIDDGDEVLVPDPGYSVYTTGTEMAGGIPIKYDLIEKNAFLPDISQLESLVTNKTKLIWLNYPNNPTGAVADLSVFKKVFEFAERFDLIIAHDNPYADISFDGYLSRSFLNIERAKERTIEFNSLSKTYNMAGWRVGMAVGNQQLISALLKIKSNIDTGIFVPLQLASIQALTGDQTWIRDRNKVYENRRDRICSILKNLGLNPIIPKSALYIWIKVNSLNVEEAAFDILEKTGVFITPGSVFGKNGEGYLRISLCQSMDVLDEVERRLANFPNNLILCFESNK